MIGKITIIVALLALILILGLILRKLGSPYNEVFLGVHKIASVGLIIFISFHHYSLIFTPVFSRPFNLAVAMRIAVVAIFTSGAILSAGTPYKNAVGDCAQNFLNCAYGLCNYLIILALKWIG